MKNNILHVLPLTENYSKKFSGAASIFIRTFANDKINKHFIIGSTNYKDYPTKNYHNIEISNSLFLGSNSYYVKKIISFIKEKNINILEVHNRPEIALRLKNETGKKIILYFHNEPQKIRKSFLPRNREEILEKIDKIIFVSEWVRSRFFDQVKQKNSSKTHVIYPTISKKKIQLKKKEKLILFIGKLNTSKGYNVFSEILPSVLNKHRKWKAITIGSEPREKIYLKHPRIHHMGWLPYEETLKYLEKSSIVLSPSSWDEPFGRVVNESTLYGNASVTSNKGGIPETNFFCINLKDYNNNSFKFELEKLIKNEKYLKKTQNNSINGFNFNLQNEIKKINDIRETFNKKINLNFNNPLKILHITDQHIRHKGRLYYSTGRKFYHGFVKLGHNIMNISDRDIISKNILGGKHLHNYVLDTCSNFRPDLILFGHADKLKAGSLFKNLNKFYTGIKTAQWFLDPLIKKGPDYEKNKKRILLKSDLIDFTFLTTHPKELTFEIKNSFFIPNPVDKSIENLKIYSRKDQVFDIFYAMSHGQHRGSLKSNIIDERSLFLKKIYDIKNLKINLFGIDKQPVWGDEFFKQLSLCRMGLNLSRGYPQKYYSSDRIAALMGNGLLTFVNKKYCYSDFFNNNEIIEYSSYSDLIDKIIYFKENDDSRIRVARNGSIKYHKLFSAEKICNYMISKIFGLKLFKREKWMI